MRNMAPMILVIALVIGLGTIFVSRNNASTASIQVTRNGEIKNGVQYVTINAKGGYSPRVSLAQAGIPTKLIVKTNGTYDCSASLVIRSIGYQKILPQTGETEINLGSQKAGQILQGLCGMGMYGFQIKFS